MTTIREQDRQRPFLEKLTKKDGDFLWEHAEIMVQPPSADGQSAHATDTVVVVPMALPNTNKVSGFITCVVGKEDVKIRLFRARHYARYGFKEKTLPNARFVAMQCMILGQKVFGTSVYRINDRRLVDNSRVPQDEPVFVKIAPR